MRDAAIDGNIVKVYVITEPEYVEEKFRQSASVAMYFYAKLNRAVESSKFSIKIVF